MLTKNIYSFPCASNKNKNHNVLLSYCACFCGYEEMHFYVYFKAHKYLSFIFGIFRLNKSSWFDGRIHYSEFENVKYKRFLLYELFISQKKVTSVQNKYYNEALKVHISLGIYFKIVLSFLSFKMQKSLL